MVRAHLQKVQAERDASADRAPPERAEPPGDDQETGEEAAATDDEVVAPNVS